MTRIVLECPRVGCPGKLHAADSVDASTPLAEELAPNRVVLACLVCGVERVLVDPRAVREPPEFETAEPAEPVELTRFDTLDSLEELGRGSR